MDYRKKDIRNALLFISPWIIGFLVFTLYPILSSLYYSFCEYLNFPSLKTAAKAAYSSQTTIYL